MVLAPNESHRGCTRPSRLSAHAPILGSQSDVGSLRLASARDMFAFASLEYYKRIKGTIVDGWHPGGRPLKIRSAEGRDIPAVTEIYNEVLRASTAIYRDEEVSLDERVLWWESQQQKGYPLFIAEEDDQVLGYASYGDFRIGRGYRYTVEGSIHLRPDARRHGTGTKLFEQLTAHARAAGKHILVAGVDAENVPSRSFLEKFGAERTGHMKEVGYKFGRYLDLLLYQIRLS
jgi:L-amino acid N-acyltransferase